MIFKKGIENREKGEICLGNVIKRWASVPMLLENKVDAKDYNIFMHKEGYYMVVKERFIGKLECLIGMMITWKYRKQNELNDKKLKNPPI